MLAREEWSIPKTQPADIFSLGALIAWLELQPADRQYCFLDTGGCLLAQYYLAHGYSHVDIGGYTVTLNGKCQEMSKAFSDIPAGYPRTFGAALARARSIA